MNNKEINQLLLANVITQETAERIRAYYLGKKNNSGFNLFTVFAIFASLLVSLGIILIIAHNWDELSGSLKVFFAFFPLIAAQCLCLYTLLRKRSITAWRESAASFLFFSFGACMALISQIYHIPGDLAAFIFTWMVICLPVIYLMNSSVVSILYIIGISYYAAETGYWSGISAPDFWYWPLLLLALPHYFILLKKHFDSNFTIYHNWLIPLSLTATLGTLSTQFSEWMYMAYMSLFAAFYLSARSSVFSSQKRRNNGYLVIGTVGTISLLLALSFEWFWEKLPQKTFEYTALIRSPEFVITLILSSLAIILLYKSKRLHKGSVKPLDLTFLVFIVVFHIGMKSMAAMVLINVMILLIGMMTIREGVRENHLGILNFGLMVITALTACRFFDTDLSFVVRGLLFIAVGIGIFILNTWMLKKRN